MITQSLTKLKYNISSVKGMYALNTIAQRANYAEKAAEPLRTSENTDSDEERLKRIRNISRLKEENYRKLHGMSPYPEPLSDHHHSLRWKRKQFGLYGMNSNIDPGICFTTKEEREDLKEYEKVAFDKSIMEIRNDALKKLAEEKEERIIREERVAANLLKTTEWKQQIIDRVQMKKEEVIESKEKRERLLEEVRRHFGYIIDMHDEKFQIMLEFKQNEQRKKERLAKKKKKEEILMAKLASLGSSSTPKSESTARRKKSREQEITDDAT